MSYTATYVETAGGVDYQAVQMVLNVLRAWQDESAQEDWDNVYRLVVFNAEAGTVRVEFSTENVPDSTAPDDAHAALQSAIDSINGSLGTSLPDAANAVNVR